MPDFFQTPNMAQDGNEIAWQRVLVTGSRSWPIDDTLKVVLALAQQHHEYGHVTVIHGDCPDQGDNGRSVDRIARAWAERVIEMQTEQAIATVRHEAYPANWDAFGKAAGPMRNKYMVNLGADVCLAFPAATSRGTISCMKLAIAAGIPVINYGYHSDEFPAAR